MLFLFIFWNTRSVCIVISRVYAVKNSIFRIFIPQISFVQARRADSEYLWSLVIFCHPMGFYHSKGQNMTKPDTYSKSARQMSNEE